MWRQSLLKRIEQLEKRAQSKKEREAKMEKLMQDTIATWLEEGATLKAYRASEARAAEQRAQARRERVAREKAQREVEALGKAEPEQVEAEVPERRDDPRCPKKPEPSRPVFKKHTVSIR